MVKINVYVKASAESTEDWKTTTTELDAVPAVGHHLALKGLGGNWYEVAIVAHGLGGPHVVAYKTDPPVSLTPAGGSSALAALRSAKSAYVPSPPVKVNIYIRPEFDSPEPWKTITMELPACPSTEQYLALKGTQGKWYGVANVIHSPGSPHVVAYLLERPVDLPESNKMGAALKSMKK
jgi:hypothetical protein